MNWKDWGDICEVPPESINYGAEHKATEILKAEGVIQISANEVNPTDWKEQINCFRQPSSSLIFEISLVRISKTKEEAA